MRATASLSRRTGCGSTPPPTSSSAVTWVAGQRGSRQKGSRQKGSRQKGSRQRTSGGMRAGGPVPALIVACRRADGGRDGGHQVAGADRSVAGGQPARQAVQVGSNGRGVGRGQALGEQRAGQARE